MSRQTPKCRVLPPSIYPPNAQTWVQATTVDHHFIRFSGARLMGVAGDIFSETLGLGDILTGWEPNIKVCTNVILWVRRQSAHHEEMVVREGPI